MRVIKFRAWCDRLNKYYYNVGVHPSILEFHEDYKEDDEGALTVCSKFDNYIIEQFTGKLDSNDVEIYENDVVEMWNIWNCKYGVVVFRGGGFGIKFKDEFETFVELRMFYGLEEDGEVICQFKKIGTIHGSLDLKEKKKLYE